jgi:hypothetical protein
MHLFLWEERFKNCVIFDVKDERQQYVRKGKEGGCDLRMM